MVWRNACWMRYMRRSLVEGGYETFDTFCDINCAQRRGGPGEATTRGAATPRWWQARSAGGWTI